MAKLAKMTYGKALLDLAVEENLVDALYEEAVAVENIVKEEKDFLLLMTHPKIPLEDKISTLDQVFGGKISKEMLGFLKLLLEKERFNELQGVLSFFIDEVKDIKGIGVAHVTTAVPLSTVQQKEIEDKLLATTKYQSMEMHFEVEPKIIGGMIVRIKDRVVDGSVETKISDLKKQLMRIQLS